jgi:hypothetical protein
MPFWYLADSSLLLVDRELQLTHGLAQAPQGRVDIQIGAGRLRRWSDEATRGGFLCARRSRRWRASTTSRRSTCSPGARRRDGMDWQRLHARDVARPTATS